MQTKFEFNSPLWTNKETWNVDAGLNGLTQNEAKLASYHNTPFIKVCLGMRENNVTNWILVNLPATSLYNVIAAGYYRKTNAGRAEWMSLINDARLQSNCNKEGFNVPLPFPKLRIGIAGNNEKDCSSCDSFIGFGIALHGRKWSSGNFCQHGCEKELTTFAYIFVQ